MYLTLFVRSASRSRDTATLAQVEVEVVHLMN